MSVCVCVCGFSSRFNSKTGRLYNITELRLLVGVHNLETDKISEGSASPSIKKLVWNPHYNFSNNAYDFALIELEDPLVYSDKISPICVDDSVFPEDTVCTVTGWGQMESKNSIFIYINLYKFDSLVDKCRSDFQRQIHACGNGIVQHFVCLHLM